MAYGLMFIHYQITKWSPMRSLYFRVPRNTTEHVPFHKNRNCRWSTPEEFLSYYAGNMLITLGVRALAWLKKEEQAHVLACCRFATLALLAGSVSNLIS